jgi:serine/threonine-protein kinase
MTPVDPANATTDYPREAQAPLAPPHLRIAHSGQPVSGATGDFEQLLQQRLRLATLLLLGICLLGLAGHGAEWLMFGWNYRPDLRVLQISCTSFAAVALSVQSWILWHRLMPLKWLRALEAVTFGLPSLLIAVNLYFMINRKDWARYAEPPLEDLGVMGRAMSTPWIFLIALYGVYIPNTARRCALVVGAMAFTALAVCTASATQVAGDNFPRHIEVSAFLGPMFFCLVTISAIAIYSSHRIEVLRQEASEARQLGQYRLTKCLGAGGMGEVYLAEHRLLRRPCAVKLIRPDKAGDPKALLRFEREVQTMATLNSWHTVEIFDYGHAEDGTFYYVMEYLPGLDLEELVYRHGPLPPERVIHLLRQVCTALREAHAAGLIHRDIKPSNVIVCRRGGLHDVAKLLDFGLVQGTGLPGPEGRLTQEGFITGTPDFMSPEQAAGQGQIDGRSDLYSVGALAYFLVTGRPPFGDLPPLKMLAAHIHEMPQPPSKHRPDLPVDLESVILCCLKKDPSLRFPDAGSLERALADCATARLWTEERAAQWWQQHGSSGVA